MSKAVIKPVSIQRAPAPFPFGEAPVVTTPEIDALLAADCVVAVGVSGGKDGAAAAIAVDQHLNRIGHRGRRLLVHSDLGRIEWKDSLPSCERLAERLGWELMVVRRKAGDMVDRWQVRWDNNKARYQDLSCVKLILPWSTPALRFCTSELKSDVINAALRKRFPIADIVSVTGIRRQESAKRSRMTVSSPIPKLRRGRYAGLAWNAVIDYTIEQVFQVNADAGVPLHEAYTRYRSSRVSCLACIMSSAEDLAASLECEDNHEVYRELVQLEIDSAFAFQDNRWLGDVAPHILSPLQRKGLAMAKLKAARRAELESQIPERLLYAKGWPTCMPTREEAELLADIRRELSDLMGLQSQYLTADEVLARYAALMAEQAVKQAKKKKTSKTKKTEAADVAA